MMHLGGFFGYKKQEADATDAARTQAHKDLDKTKDALDVRFTHLEELVAATLAELREGRGPSNQLKEEKKKQ